MSQLIEMLQQALGQEGLARMSQQIGADPKATESAVGAALPALVGALSRQGSSEQGASGLMKMLDRDGDGNILDDLQGLLGASAGAGPGSGRGSDGMAILQQLMGGRTERLQQGVSQASGLDAGSTGKLLGMLAPMVLGALAKQKNSQSLDVGGLMGFLGQEKTSVEQKTGGLIGRLLDQDGDGDFDLGDIAKLAMGKLFGRK